MQVVLVLGLMRVSQPLLDGIKCILMSPRDEVYFGLCQTKLHYSEYTG